MRFLTSGESHGPQLTGIIEGLPSRLPLSVEDINPWLRKRQGGYGRGRRMVIETDTVELVSGVQAGRTTAGSCPVGCGWRRTSSSRRYWAL